MTKRASVAVPLKFFGQARTTVRAQLAAAAEESAGARATLSEFLRIHLEFLGANPEIAALLYDDAAAPAGERALCEHRRLMLFLISKFERIVVDGKKAKRIRGDVDPAMAAVHYLGVVQMAWMFWTISGRRGDLIDAGIQFFEQFWAGIGT